MAQKVRVELVDDLDGSEATTTVSFALDGQGYEIDLNDKNASEMRNALAKYVGAARRSGNRPAYKTRAGKVPTPRTGPDPKLVREWAEKQKIELPERGRLPKDVVEKYEAAQAKK